MFVIGLIRSVVQSSEPSTVQLPLELTARLSETVPHFRSLPEIIRKILTDLKNGKFLLSGE